MGALDCVTLTDGLRSSRTESTEVFTIAASTASLKVRTDEESQISKSDSISKPHSVWWTFGIDVPLIILVVILISLFELNVIPSYKAGFYCNDPKLNYPYKGDTVSAAFLMTSVILMPMIVIFTTELIFLDSNYLRRPRAHQAIRNCLWLYRVYACGLFFNLGFIELLKGISGSPRPDFFEVCKPDTAATCQGSEFVRAFQCTSDFSWWMRLDSYHSFPSGHASISVYCGLFIAWYLQRRAFDWRHRTVFMVPVLQLGCASYSAVCSITRVTDYRHHWWDVATGTVIGVVCLFYAVLVHGKHFAFFASTKTARDVRECQRIQSHDDIVVSY